MYKNLFLLCFLIFGSFALNAQNIHIGFKTGLNFAHLDGPSELDAAGKSLESWKNVTGFHIGATFTYKFNTAFGLRGEFLYSKKGGKYTYSGDGFRVFKSLSGGNPIYSTGKVDYLVNINNTYLDFPIVGLARWKNFELSAGANFGVLIQSVGVGSLNYVSSDINSTDNKVQFNLNHNYKRDDVGEAETASTFVVKVKNQNVELPKTLGAYYDLTEDKGNLYKPLNVDVVFGLTYYISRALYFSGRLYYGLSDVTNNNADFSKYTTNSDKTLIPRSDKDRNFVIQTSVGFSF